MVESVIVSPDSYGLILRGLFKNRKMANSCILVHAYDALKGRPCEVRSV